MISAVYMLLLMNHGNCASLLAGLYEPTNGTAHIAGYDRATEGVASSVKGVSYRGCG